ncbi:ATP synthase F1 subunit delta [Candidatus Sulfidibacterium hydrothermale]|uniref:ATP synthase F1 subunit delta n=1 Tax=Candidatus Sulfidibacterium hydrothermale TaxID=2875962 RepID=UPI001F0B7002|nr:ATP synthase F1 subunit delta [Candidatus Sulfidibacterium hydrothermale]UBM62287.1 ATP synthase F1 subunit delta [Candidatus Sulfidibacterium hydrothermale]
MRVNLLAKRYAQALFGLALENKTEEKIAEDMRLVGRVLGENRELRRVMSNPVLQDEKKVKILYRLFEKNISKLTLRFFDLLIRKRREVYLDAICVAFEEIYLDYKNIVKAELITATGADEKIRKQVIEKLKSITDKKIELSDKTDADLIGGFVARLGDYQYDASVATQLRKLRKSYAEQLK